MHVIATAGHVDHGKSALLRRLTGMEPDRWAEERRRGLTIDLGYVWTELAGPDGTALTLAFVDVPGHDSFLPNMLCGVGVVDRVLLVVAADDGWSAQSEEHLEILDLLDRRALAAVVTKSELAGPERTAEVVADVTARLAATSLRGAPVLAVDSLSGAGFEQLRATMIERLTGTDPTRPSHPTDAGAEADGARLWVDRVFTIKGAGTVATGMLASGRLQVGQDVEVAPQGLVGRVRGLECLGQAVTAAGPGTRVAVNLGGIAHDALGRGDVLLGARRAGAARVSTAVDVQLRALPHSSIGRSGAWHLHVGTAATTVRVLPLLGDLEPGTSAPARLELSEPVPFRAGDRFVLREAGRRRTAGGGVVLDPLPGPRQRGTERRLTHALALERLDDAADPGPADPGPADAGPADPDARGERVQALVDAHGGIRDLAHLQTILGCSTRRLVEVVESAGLAVLAGRVVRRDLLERWSNRILTTARQAPAEQAVELSRLTAAAVDAGCPRELAAGLVDHAVDQGSLRRHGGRLVHRDHDEAYLAARAVRRDAFLAELARSPYEPADPATLAADAAIPSFEVQELVDEGSVVAAGPLLFAATAVVAAAETLRQGVGRDGAAFTASEARQAWGTNRRSAVPLLDHLRASGVTTFDGTHHRLTAP